MTVRSWTAAFQGLPQPTDLVSQGDDEIRDLKDTLEAELYVEHDLGLTGTFTDSGRHVPGSARAYFQAALPTNLVEFDGTTPQTDKLTSNSLDDGRLWVDTDDGQPYVRDQSISLPAGFGGAAAWASLWPRTWTTMSTGSVGNERPGAPTNDTRDTITGISAVSIAIPNDGRSYELLVRAVVKFQYDVAGEHAALWLQETAPAAADRDVAFITTVGNTELAGTAVLEYGYFPATNNTTYTFDVEMAASAAASFYVNPTATVIDGGIGAPYNTVGSFSRLFLTVRPTYGPGY